MAAALRTSPYSSADEVGAADGNERLELLREDLVMIADELLELLARGAPRSDTVDALERIRGLRFVRRGHYAGEGLPTKAADAEGARRPVVKRHHHAAVRSQPIDAA